MEYMGGKKCAEGAGNISVLDWSHASAIYEACLLYTSPSPRD